MSTSPEKFYKPNKVTPNSETIVKISSASNLNIQPQTPNPSEDTIIEWRKNINPLVVGVRNCHYSSIRTPTKLINIPA